MRRLRFIGIRGAAMATLAAMLMRRGLEVQGSDEGVYSPMSDLLAAEQIRVFPGYRAEHIMDDVDGVVVGNVVSRGNPGLEAVLTRRLRYWSLPEMVREQFLWRSRSIVIAGTHGKTTTTALVGWVLTCGGAGPSVLVGGIANNFASRFRLGAGGDFVIQGDEDDSVFFDKTAKFLKYLPQIALVGNVELSGFGRDPARFPAVRPAHCPRGAARRRGGQSRRAGPGCCRTLSGRNVRPERSSRMARGRRGRPCGRHDVPAPPAGPPGL